MGIETKVLLGWLDRATAIRFLTIECENDPPLNDAQAEAIWQPYHDRVQALAERPRGAPTEYKFTKAERKHVKMFARKARGVDRAFKRVVKIDLMDLAVHQFNVLTARSEGEYANRVCNDGGWRKHCLRLRPAPRQIPIQSQTPNSIVWDIPHAEFDVAVGTNPKTGEQVIAPSEWSRWVIAAPCDGRWMLWCGYHRSYARMAYMNDGDPDGAAERAVPIVLFEKLTARDAPAALERARGLRPALFRDFFDENLFFTVQLRRKRYELRATINGNRVDWSRSDAYA